jgi:uncharacterized membrane protein
MKNSKHIFEYSRTVALIDGIYAIAMTILVLTIEPPKVPFDDLPATLIGDLDTFLIYAISFLILGSFWMSHQKLFYRMEKVPEKYVWLNIYTMVFICLIPFALDLAIDYNNSTYGMITFHLILLGCGLMNHLLWKKAFQYKIFKEEFLHEKYDRLAGLIMPISSIIGILLSFFIPSWSPIVYLFSPIFLKTFTKK